MASQYLAHFDFAPNTINYASTRSSHKAEGNEEEISIDDALASFVEQRRLVGVRRSARLEQGSANRIDHRLAELLQEEILQNAVHP